MGEAYSRPDLHWYNRFSDAAALVAAVVVWVAAYITNVSWFGTGPRVARYCAWTVMMLCRVSWSIRFDVT